MKFAELFEGRFDIEEDEDGVSLICTECSATFKIPSAVDGAVELDDVLHAQRIIALIKRILEHLDECRAGVA
jgi:RecB family exonuclease